MVAFHKLKKLIARLALPPTGTGARKRIRAGAGGRRLYRNGWELSRMSLKRALHLLQRDRCGGAKDQACSVSHFDRDLSGQTANCSIHDQLS